MYSEKPSDMFKKSLLTKQSMTLDGFTQKQKQNSNEIEIRKKNSSCC